jgi:hypothetical protein
MDIYLAQETFFSQLFLTNTQHTKLPPHSPVKLRKKIIKYKKEKKNFLIDQCHNYCISAIPHNRCLAPMMYCKDTVGTLFP